MRRLLGIIFLQNLFFATACILVCQSTAAPAGPVTIPGTIAREYTRYYAPYALQAAAAYIAVGELDRTLRNFQGSTNPAAKSGDPPLNGADIDRVMQDYGADSQTVKRARDYLEAWQYQFGSDTYLTCYDTSDANCMSAYRESGAQPFSEGPKFQVWARTHVSHVDHDACSEVSIAFRGTESWLGPDGVTNAEPITQAANAVRSFFTGRNYETDDYYHQLRRNIDAIIKRITGLDCYKRAKDHPRIVSVGHSLGGGLAQFAALAVIKGPRIAKVFAFNSSPVTGSWLLKRELLNTNAKGVADGGSLEIDRIYQPGEAVSKYLWPVTWFQYPSASSTCGPLVRTVRFDVRDSDSSTDLHEMRPFAAYIVNSTYIQQTQLPYEAPSSSGCQTRYHPPTDDRNDVPVPSVNPADQMVYAPNGALVHSARINRHKASNLFAGEQSGAGANWMWTEDRLNATPPTAKKGRRVHTAHL
jgi:hypothetical protein